MVEFDIIVVKSRYLIEFDTIINKASSFKIIKLSSIFVHITYDLDIPRL